MKFLELYISAIIMWILFYKIGLMVFNKKNNFPKLYIILIITIFSFVLALINYSRYDAIGEIIKIIVVYGLMLLFNKILYLNTYSEVVFGSIILFLTYVISEAAIALILSIIIAFLNEPSLKIIQDSILINIIIPVCVYIIVLLDSKKFSMIIKENKYTKKSNIIIIILILLTAILLLVRIPVNQWTLNIEFIITMSILFCFCIIGFLMLKQKADIQKTTSMYQKLADYADITNNLLEDYRVVSHEQKNQLLIIRSMIDESNQELVDYVDNLLDKRTGMKYEWIGQLNYLPLSGLKGLINYKLIEMSKEKINTNISISKEVTKTRIDKLSTKQKDNLYSIIGVYLDNAIQAARESKQKEISLEIYKEKKEVIFILANTYKGLVDIDKVETYGYTTKGKNHGVGLHIVKKIIEEETIFSQSRNLYEDYYVQELRIHLDQLKKK